MTLEQVGAYALLLEHQACSPIGRLPLDHAQLARMLGVTVRKFTSLWAAVKIKFEQDEDGYYNVKLDQTLRRARRIIEKKKAAARARWDAEGDAPAHAPAHADASQVQMQTRVTRDVTSLNSKYLDSEVDAAGRVLDLLNEKTSRSFPLKSPKGGITENAREIVARLRDGWSEDDLRAVVVRRWRRWKDDPKLSDYLQPSTLFRKSNFERYVAEVGR